MDFPLKAIVISTLALLGVAAGVTVKSFYSNASKEAGGTPTLRETAPGRAALAQVASASAMGVCVPPSDATKPVAMIEKMERRGRDLEMQRRYDVALTEFRSVASADPGFPGVNLEMSVSLLKLKDAEEAKKAVDTQTALSACLAKLPEEQLTAYCGSQGLASAERCHERLQEIRRTAYFQSALVNVELGHAVGSEPMRSVAKVEPNAPLHPKPSHVAATMGDRTAPARTETAMSKREMTLRNAAGTDSALGAYAK